jgi:hypothetical protein
LFLFFTRAYLQWYKLYGVEEYDFQEAFDTVHSLIENYTGAL